MFFIVLLGQSWVSLKKLINKHAMKGFSLLEVLVALIVAAIALVALIHGLSQYANSIIYLRDKLNAQTIAVGELSHRVLDKSYIIPEFVEIGGAKLELIMTEEDYFFKEIQDMKKITVTVFDADEQQLLSVSSITR